MTPSKYQSDFYAELRDGTGDIQLVAVAGSGKTYSLQEGASRLPWDVQCGTLMTAFNAHIRAELKHRQDVGLISSDVTIQTIHSLGYGAVRQHFQPRNGRTWVDEKKYEKLAGMWWERERLPRDDEGYAALQAVSRVARLAMLTLTRAGDLAAMADRYSIDVPDDLAGPVYAAASEILLWGREGAPAPDKLGLTYHPAERISFDDMIWLPVELGLPVPQYEMVMVDEAQDLSRVQQELLLRTRPDGGRACWVGDPNQAIYGFAGADAEGFDRIQALTAAKRMPLSICYRCGRRIVERAQQLVPQIEAWEQADEGRVVEDVPESDLLELARAHYAERPAEKLMLLCRTNAPLVFAALWLLRQGVPARVRGRDIGAQLADTLDKIVAVEGFSFERLPHFTDVYVGRELARSYYQREGGEMRIAALTDRVESLIAVWDHVQGNGYPGLDGMRRYLRELFSDEERSVLLSSIHKAKGLEAERVGILHAELLPHPMAWSGWQLEQERNLEYVGITRARRELYISRG